MVEKIRDVLAGREDNYLLPFFWQRGNHRDRLRGDIETIYSSGCRALCVESRPHPEFSRDGWWADMEIILDECAKRGMEVWILDDDKFPTGHANSGLKNHPELRQWHISENHIDVAGPMKNARIMIPETNEENILLGAYMYKRVGEGEGITHEGYVDLTSKIDGDWLIFDIPDGVSRIFFVIKTRRGSMYPEYIDMLNEESVKVLIDEVYEKHYEHFKRYFGTTLVGFFSDEPRLGNAYAGEHDYDYGFYNRRLGMPALALPWNDALIGFMSECGIEGDVISYLPALWYDMESVGPLVRHSFMDGVTRRYRDCFTRQIGNWCRAHGVEYIGHIIEDMNTHARLSCSGGHYFRSLDGQDMSGIDIVLHQIMPGMSDFIHTASTFGNNASPAFFDYVLGKLGSSAAHINPQYKGRAMCEVFGAYGWAEDTRTMKFLIDYLLVRGINRFVPHAFSPDFPDPDCPPHFGVHGKDPQYEGFSALMRYTNKAAHILSGGVHVADVALLYFADSEWMSPHERESLGRECAMTDDRPAKILYDLHIDYDIVPTDCFRDDSGSSVYRAKAEGGRLRIGEETYGALIVPSGLLPDFMEDELRLLSSEGVPIIRLTENGVKTDDRVQLSELEEVVKKTVSCDVIIDGERFTRVFHKKDGESDIYMFANEAVSLESEFTAQLSAVSCRDGLLLDLLNGTAEKIRVKDGQLSITLSPYQSVIAVFGDVDSITSTLSEYRKIEKLGEADLTVVKREYAPYTDLKSFTETEITADFSGKARYTCALKLSGGLSDSDRLYINLGNIGGTAEMKINGEDCGIRICPPYRFDLTGKTKDGENRVEIVFSNTLANAVKDKFSRWMTVSPLGLNDNVILER